MTNQLFFIFCLYKTIDLSCQGYIGQAIALRNTVVKEWRTWITQITYIKLQIFVHRHSKSTPMHKKLDVQTLNIDIV